MQKYWPLGGLKRTNIADFIVEFVCEKIANKNTTFNAVFVDGRVLYLLKQKIMLKCNVTLHNYDSE